MPAKTKRPAVRGRRPAKATPRVTKLSRPLAFLNTRIFFVLIGVVVAGVIAVAYSSAATASPEIKSGLASKCLDDYRNSSANGNKVDSYLCNGSGAQQWVAHSDGTIRVFGKCLDVYGKRTANGTKVDLYTCNGGKNQQWTYNKARNAIVSAQSGKCLDTPGASFVNGTQVQIWSCVYDIQQKWYYGTFTRPGSTPTPKPTVNPTVNPTSNPTPGPTSNPTPGPTAAPTPGPSTGGPFTLNWTSNFSTDKALGSFGNCTENSCPNVPGWGAYPNGWPDTAIERGGYAVGGYYDPGTTTWISGGQMHVKMWRGASGSVHSDALVPLAAFAKTYGKYVETSRVSHVTTGYKSAHLLYSTGNQNDEIDYPEAQWDDSSINAYIHFREQNLPQQTFQSNVNWSSWHTTEVDWTPGHLSFYMDGKQIGSTTTGISSNPMKWIIQNESALNGESAPLNSSAQMDISSVSYYTYN